MYAFRDSRVVKDIRFRVDGPSLNPGGDVHSTFYFVFFFLFRTGHCLGDILFLLCVWSRSLFNNIEPCF